MPIPDVMIVGGGGGGSWATYIFIEMQYIITLQCFRHDEVAALDSSLLYAGRSHGSFDLNVTEINIKSGERLNEWTNE